MNTLFLYLKNTKPFFKVHWSWNLRIAEYYYWSKKDLCRPQKQFDLSKLKPLKVVKEFLMLLW